MSLADKLERDGVCVVTNDIFSDPRCREELLLEATKFPEFLPGTNKFIQGGFSALGNPASFHNPVVRRFREWAHAIVVDKVFRGTVAKKKAIDGMDWKLEQKVERMTIRNSGETPSKESWHRDQAVIATTPSDIVMGGWINLDPVPQYFSCVLRSHLTGVNTNGGFVKVSKEKAAEIKERKLSTKIQIPPGGILVFAENIIHEVLAKKLKYRMVRLHTAWRLTPGPSVMSEEMRDQFERQAPVTIKSGQSPPMYPLLSWVNWTDKLQDWSVRNMRPECTEERTMVGRQAQGGNIHRGPPPHERPGGIRI
ncbi:unnamed protein product [Ectocarpus sp. 6 AP-2014]